MKLRKTLAALAAPPTPHNLPVCGQHPGGRQVAGVLDPDKLLDVLSGLAGLRVEPVISAAVAPEQVFGALEQQRRSGQLSVGVSSAALRYQASTTQPGFLEEVASDGRRRLGQFRHGVFEPLEPPLPGKMTPLQPDHIHPPGSLMEQGNASLQQDEQS